MNRLKSGRSNLSRRSFRGRRAWGYRRSGHRRWRRFWFRHPLIGAWLLASLMFVLIWGATKKIWVCTPPGLTPEIRVSLLDLAHAWSAGRGAAVRQREGDWRDALALWRQAASHWPGNRRLNRRVLDLLEKIPPTPESAGDAQLYGARLLWLSSENENDLLRVARVYEHCRLFAALRDLFEDRRDSLPLEAKLIYGRALFHLGEYEAFHGYWLKRGEEWQGDPVMEVYRWGARAILDEGGTALGTLRRTYDAIDVSSSDYVKSRRVALAVHCALGQRWIGQSMLDELRRQGAAYIPDYVVYWNLLLQRDESGDVLCREAILGNPTSDRESVALVQVLRRADFEALALGAAKQGVEWFGDAGAEIWLTMGDLLIERQDTEALVNLGQRIQASARSFETEPIRLYWKAVLAKEQRDSERVGALCGAIASVPPREPSLRLELAKRVVALGEWEAGDSLVISLTGTRDEVRDYWVSRCEQALAQQDFRNFDQAACVAFESDGDYLPHVWNYLRALVRERNQEEAVILCARLMAATRDDGQVVASRLGNLVREAAWEEALRMMDGLDRMD